MSKLDRTAFKIQTFKEADHNREEWLKKTPEERWADSWYLLASAYGFDPENPPRMDKTVFSMRKQCE